MTKRLLAPLEIRNIDAHSDRTAVRGPAVLVTNPLTAAKLLLPRTPRSRVLSEPKGQPFLRILNLLGLSSPIEAGPQNVLEADTGRQDIGDIIVELGVSLVPQDQPIL